jgi:hypothetical protein
MNQHIELFEFIIYRVFDTPPRLLFDKFFKDKDDVRGLSINTILRYIELGWFHDSSGKVLHHRANAVFKCDEMDQLRRLIIAKILLLPILKKMFELLPDAVSSLVTDFIGFVDLSSLHFYKTFYLFLRLKISVESSFSRIFSLFDDLDKIHSSSYKRINLRLSPLSLKRLRGSEDD